MFEYNINEKCLLIYFKNKIDYGLNIDLCIRKELR